MGDAYNKFPQFPNGTLEGNWFEERVLRESTGFGRAQVNNHIPKNSKGPLYNRKRDGSHSRLFGDGDDELLITFNQQYGKETNPVESFRKVGIREEILTKQWEQAMWEELRQNEERNNK